ncbi:MAG TPA: hypothetical protein VLW50_10590 [Streptosporangiaceae bacterium]|nr:hypothetical protein [Streptosporangiaceae bacterium]
MTPHETALADLTTRFPAWEAWFGIDHLWHARVKGATPPVMVRGESAEDLADEIVRHEGRQH